MNSLQGIGPGLGAAEASRRREHLVTEAAMRAEAARRRRRVWGVSAVATLMLGGVGGGMAIAQGHGIERGPGGETVIDNDALSPAYQGHKITSEELAQLKSRGLARSAVSNAELACRGVILYFDTDAEADRYISDFAERHPISERVANREGDLCALYTDAPEFPAQQ